MILTLITGEKVTVKESFDELDSIAYIDLTEFVDLIELTKLNDNGGEVKDGILKRVYKESVIRVNVNHIVSYE